MDLLSLLLGIVLLVMVSLDILITTISADEHAIISFRIARRLFRRLRRLGLQRRTVWSYRLIGPLTMFFLAAIWVIFVSLAWTLIFAAFPGAVTAAQGQPPPGWWDVYGHVGHLLSTLGLETTQPGGTVSYVLGTFVAVNGFVLVTLATSFTLSTTQTVTRGRAFAALTQGLDPAEASHFTTLAPQLAQICSSLRSSPYALFYSSGERHLRLPSVLEQFGRRAAEGSDFGRYRKILAQLPDLDVRRDRNLSDAEFLDHLARWSRRYAFD